MCVCICVTTCIWCLCVVSQCVLVFVCDAFYLQSQTIARHASTHTHDYQYVRRSGGIVSETKKLLCTHTRSQRFLYSISCFTFPSQLRRGKWRGKWRAPEIACTSVCLRVCLPIATNRLTSHHHTLTHTHSHAVLSSPSNDRPWREHTCAHLFGV